jgi:hypothetical protein
MIVPHRTPMRHHAGMSRSMVQLCDTPPEASHKKFPLLLSVRRTGCFEVAFRALLIERQKTLVLCIQRGAFLLYSFSPASFTPYGLGGFGIFFI